MYKKKIILSVVTPEGIKYQEEKEQIKFCGENGFFEILSNHQSYMSILKRSSILEYKKGIFNPFILIDNAILVFHHESNTCKIITQFAFDLKYSDKSSLFFKNSSHPFFKYVKLFIKQNKTFTTQF